MLFSYEMWSLHAADIVKAILKPTARTIEAIMTEHRLFWLGHVLCMSAIWLPGWALYSEAGSKRRKRRGGQLLTWKQTMQVLTTNMGRVGLNRLPGWGPSDDGNEYLRTLIDVPKTRSRWCLCCLSSLNELYFNFLCVILAICLTSNFYSMVLDTTPSCWCSNSNYCKDYILKDGSSTSKSNSAGQQHKPNSRIPT